MGIKFYCPNGHKLNVKAFLAGKKAICPKCGVKVVVPTGLTETTGQAETQSEPILVDPEELEALATAQASAVGRQTSGAEQSSSSGNSAGHPAPAANVLAASAAPLANGPAVVDPIEEAPTAVWYVRPPSGGQFGPAGGETMRSWLKEGRVTGDTLVWRAGWPEWKMASSAFPQQIPGAAPAPGATVPPVPPAMAPVARAVTAAVRVPQATLVTGAAALAPVAPVNAVPTAAAVLPVGQLAVGQVAQAPLESLTGDLYEGTYRRRRRRRSQDVTKIVTGVLIVLTIVLVVILAIVVKMQADAQKPAAYVPDHARQSGRDAAIAPRACLLLETA